VAGTLEKKRTTEIAASLPPDDGKKSSSPISHSTPSDPIKSHRFNQNCDQSMTRENRKISPPSHLGTWRDYNLLVPGNRKHIPEGAVDLVSEAEVSQPEEAGHEFDQGTSEGSRAARDTPSLRPRARLGHAKCFLTRMYNCHRDLPEISPLDHPHGEVRSWKADRSGSVRCLLVGVGVGWPEEGQRQQQACTQPRPTSCVRGICARGNWQNSKVTRV
jgi:hypothetical protein